jgi:hypothetical protein
VETHQDLFQVTPQDEVTYQVTNQEEEKDVSNIPISFQIQCALQAQ